LISYSGTDAAITGSKGLEFWSLERELEFSAVAISLVCYDALLVLALFNYHPA